MGRKRDDMLEVNWKAVRDVDNEGYHVPIAHPALHDLYGQQLSRRPAACAACRARKARISGVSTALLERAELCEAPPATWSICRRRRSGRWVYLGMFPNLVIMLYPDLIGFYQEVPVDVGKTVQRMAYYAPPIDGRQAKVARYLAHRIDRVTGAEDTQLIKWSWESMQSSGFSGMILSDLEAGVRDYHDMLRRTMPVIGARPTSRPRARSRRSTRRCSPPSATERARLRPPCRPKAGHGTVMSQQEA